MREGEMKKKREKEGEKEVIQNRSPETTVFFITKLRHDTPLLLLYTAIHRPAQV